MEKYLLNFIKSFQPETSHFLTIQLLKYLAFTINQKKDDPMLSTSIAGLKINNPIGLAAGFDKNAEVINAMSRIGFGFIECGTTTIKPQYGNPKPRIFRLEEDNALINRLGFNNKGILIFLMILLSLGNIGFIVGPTFFVNFTFLFIAQGIIKISEKTIAASKL